MTARRPDANLFRVTSSGAPPSENPLLRRGRVLGADKSESRGGTARQRARRLSEAPHGRRAALADRIPSAGWGGWALAAWLVCLPIALALPGLVGLSPLSLRGSATPLLAGGVALVGGAVAASRWHGETVPDVAAGMLAGWVVLTMHTALYGTPFGFGGLVGDMGRVSAMASRYATTLHSSDGIVGSVPADYPPLFPWLIGRAAVLSGAPAWRLLGLAEALLMSAAIVCPYLLWRRLLPAGVALAVTVTCFAVFVEPEKPYEVLSLGVAIPWTLLTFANPPSGRMHWLTAGIIGGLQVLLYQGYLMFAALGIVALVAVAVRAPGRGAYARHVTGVVLTALVVSSWYLVPYLGWAVTHGLQATDRYQDPMIAANPFPFVSLSPSGVVTAIGALGLVWYRRRAWWASSLALLTLSAYAFRFVAELGFVFDGDTEVFQYTVHAVTATLAVAGVLSLVRAVPRILRRLSIDRPPAGTGALIICALVAGVGAVAWFTWMPGAPQGTIDGPALTSHANQASQAFLQPLPDGRYPRFSPARGREPWFPTDPVIRDVHSVLGPHDAPRTLSFSEQLFSVEPWPGYLGVGANAAASTSDWYSRLAALQALAREGTPQAFATASAHTPYGPIDVFVLQRQGRSWDWVPTNYPATVRFRPGQFAPSRFVVFRGLPDATVVAVRRQISG